MSGGRWKGGIYIRLSATWIRLTHLGKCFPKCPKWSDQLKVEPRLRLMLRPGMHTGRLAAPTLNPASLWRQACVTSPQRGITDGRTELALLLLLLPKLLSPHSAHHWPLYLEAAVLRAKSSSNHERDITVIGRYQDVISIKMQLKQGISVHTNNTAG